MSTKLYDVRSTCPCYVEMHIWADSEEGALKIYNEHIMFLSAIWIDEDRDIDSDPVVDDGTIHIDVMTNQGDTTIELEADLDDEEE